ncbi:hypothetical protein [Verrucosispora sp. NA02020]|uniref:hypothetical protein n=1 Tax=Verrucosispora sp. NA02020 TaxID=2742132 RepID=UPI00159007EE|nr:hypothetical protein [Verrucosispora sp. NA02020]QKW15411.1 hypothetical protein HUT12_23365 [Verrucosispora sp. NA02020]
MSDELHPGAPGSGQPLTAQLSRWVAVARGNDNFLVISSFAVVILTIAMLFMHTDTYSVNVNHHAAFGGSLVGLAISILAATVAVATVRTWPVNRWRALAAVALALSLTFALLPPITAGYGWLTLLLFALTTLGYEALVVSWLLIARPWTWIQGFSS